MRIAMAFFLAASLTAMGAARAQSYDTGSSRAQSPSLFYGDAVQRSWAGFLAANAGYTGYNNNLSVEGEPSSLKLLGSYVIPNQMVVFDLGYGLENQSFSQNHAVNSGMSTGVLELAARYKFDNRWQLGGVYNQFFNKGANYGANQGDAEFLGVHLLREFSMSDGFIGRIGGRIMTSMNVESEPVNMAVIDFQIGWGGTGRNFSTSSND